MKSEDYLEFLDGNLTSHNFNCPFPLPTARPYQAIILIAVTYESAVNLQDILKMAGHKMNKEAITAFRQEIGQAYFDIMNWKAGIEN